MGYNTTVVLMNDALDAIEKDSDFNRKLASAVRAAGAYRKPVDVSALGHVNAATVVETHHADQVHMVRVGGNMGGDLGYSGYYRSTDLELVKNLAERLGYRLVKKPKKKEG